MTKNRSVKQKVRALAAEHGVNYTTALRMFEAERDAAAGESRKLPTRPNSDNHADQHPTSSP